MVWCLFTQVTNLPSGASLPREPPCELLFVSNVPSSAADLDLLSSEVDDDLAGSLAVAMFGC